MNESNLERLSALADGELGEPEARSLLGRLGEEPELGRHWARYHLIGAVLREETAALPADFAARVIARLEAEPVVLAPKAPRQRPRLARPLTGMAIAASVAALAVVAVQRLEPPQPEPARLAAAPAAPAALSGAGAAPVVPVAAGAGVTRPAHLINGYIVHFNEARAPAGVSGFNPYVRIVGYENAQPAP